MNRALVIDDGSGFEEIIKGIILEFNTKTPLQQDYYLKVQIFDFPPILKRCAVFSIKLVLPTRQQHNELKMEKIVLVFKNTRPAAFLRF